MKVYLESSAALAWLLGEERGERVREMLISAESVSTSDLTRLECERSLIRAVRQGRLSETESADKRAELTTAWFSWESLRISPEIIRHAARPFPAEPIRSLDAIHLASALSVRSATPALGMLSLDDRVREAARLLGFRLHPE